MQIGMVERVAVLPDQVRDPQTYAIIGAAMEVHRHLGPGFLESVYQEALALELGHRGIAHGREVEFPVFYKEAELSARFRVDFVCNHSVIVEIKALAGLTAVEGRQVINDLKASKVNRGLLVNFGRESLEFKRYVLSKSKTASTDCADFAD
jgi:GxxExxY protein